MKLKNRKTKFQRQENFYKKFASKTSSRLGVRYLRFDWRMITAQKKERLSFWLVGRVFYFGSSFSLRLQL
jgi:abortive infection bacteriophage resistance protein